MAGESALHALGDDWDMISDCDAFWAVLSDPEHKHGKWSEVDFFKLGMDEIETVMATAETYLGPLQNRRRALDFGCGIGRLTRALGHVFESCDGVDISTNMVSQARILNADHKNLHFHVNRDPDLKLFADHHFDFIYSGLVLQHIPDRDQILRTLAEFVRITASGGVIAFQLPPTLPWFIRIQPRRKLFSALKRIGVPPEYLYNKLGLHPIRMNCVSEFCINRHLNDCGAPVVHMARASDSYFHFPINTYYCRKLSA